MNRVEEIEAAISGLAPEEYQLLLQWLRAREQSRWDEQIDRDSDEGKLDLFLKRPRMSLRRALFASGRRRSEVCCDAPFLGTLLFLAR
jgi:hypothetical protein